VLVPVPALACAQVLPWGAEPPVTGQGKQGPWPVFKTGTPELRATEDPRDTTRHCNEV